MNSKERTKCLSPVWSRSRDFFVDYGLGAYPYTTNRRRYLDFTSGIGVTNIGHAHPKVVQAIRNQAAKLIHGQANIVYHEPMIRLSEELSQIVPPEHLTIPSAGFRLSSSIKSKFRRLWPFSTVPFKKPGN